MQSEDARSAVMIVLGLFEGLSNDVSFGILDGIRIQTGTQIRWANGSP